MIAKSNAMFVRSKEITSKKDSSEYVVLSFLPEKSATVLDLIVSKEDAKGYEDLHEKQDYEITCSLSASREHQGFYRMTLNSVKAI